MKLDRIMYWLFCALFFLLPVTTSPAVIVGGLILMLWLFSGQIWTRRQRYMGQPWLWPVIIMMALPFVGLLYTINIDAGLKTVEKSYYWLFVFAFAALDIDKAQRRRLIDFFLAGASFSFLVSILQLMRLVPFHRNVSATGFMNHINYALYMVFAILVLSFYFKQGGSRAKKIAYAALMLAFAVSVTISISRIGHVALIMTSPLVLMNMFGKKNALLAIVGAALIAGLMLLSPVVRDRLAHVKTDIEEYNVGNVDTSVGLRLHMWRGAALIFADNPVAGVGTGGYSKAMLKYDETERLGLLGHPHSSFMYMAASYGTMGLMALFWFLWTLFMKGWRGRAGLEGYTVLAFFVVLIIGSLTDTQIITYSTGVMTALMTGMAVE